LSRPASKGSKGSKARKPKTQKRSWGAYLTLLVLLAVGVMAGALAWLHMPMGFKPAKTQINSQVNIQVNGPSQLLDLNIEPGTSPKAVAQAISDAGADVSPQLLWLWFRVSGQDRAIKAGSYELNAEMTPKSVLNMLARGEESLRSVTLLEGWTFKQFRQALAKSESIKLSTQGLSNEDIMALLGRPNLHPEGRFYPDTYTYSKGSTDLAVMNRALKSMDRHLTEVWMQKTPQIRLKSPDELLILASIVEKETGRASDRPLISAVFHNRLKIGMRLQTDPTVIYGLGDAFDGNLRRVDLKTDTPYNTYTRNGLPPTPIAMPGKAALMAAIQPASSNALYFVAKGDGTSHFSQSLNEHNQAVNKYQRGLSQ
jgi:UPF0755 protein